MTYWLYRVDGIDQPADDGNFLGAYRSWEDAIVDRDDDVLGLLGDVDGAPIIAYHRVIGPGLAGPYTDHLLACSVGRENLPMTVEAVEAELLDTRRWLRTQRAVQVGGQRS